jgi:hypothetical protein
MYPNPSLYKCIKTLYKEQINTPASNGDTYKIHVVDSDSTDDTYYKEVERDFPDVEIHMVKNKNYEYGAWKYILDKYPEFELYFCIQDYITVKSYINLSIVNDTNAYGFHADSGYNSHLSIKEIGIENLKGSRLNYESLINTNFNLAQHSSFIVNNKTIKDIFEHLKIPPVNKDGSCFYERNFGIYFIDKGINMINLYTYLDKCCIGRI